MTIGFPTALFLIFLVLKLTGHISWAWLWVCAPLWVPTAIIFTVIAISGVFAGFCFLFAAILEKFRR